MFIFVPSPTLRGLLTVAFASLAASHATAQNASAWVSDQHSSVRLIAGQRKGEMLLGGIAFKLQPGWKTYWRTPGDSGLPPRFDFSTSDNIEMVTVLWPAPMQFADGAGGTSFGYQKQVILPVRVVAKRADKPVTLRAKIDYAVCEKLCLPVEAKVEISFPDNEGTQDPLILAALETIPQSVRIGAANALTIRRIKRNENVVLVDVVTPDAQEAALFAEGPTPDWALPPPKLLERTPAGIQRFSFNLEGLPPGTRPKGAALKLTLVGGGRAYEFDTTLD